MIHYNNDSNAYCSAINAHNFETGEDNDVTKCGFASRNILGRRCKPLEARAAGNVAA